MNDRADTDRPENSADVLTAEVRDKLTLLQKEYRRRHAAGSADLTIANWRLQEAAVLLTEKESAITGDAPEEMFAGLREKYLAFLTPLLSEIASPLDEFAIRTALCDAIADTLMSKALFGAKSFAEPEKRPQTAFSYEERGFFLDEMPIFPPATKEEGEKIAYVRNHFADMAYDHFFPYLNAPKATYAESFSAAAELLADGEGTGILLPYETEDGRLLRSVEQLLDAYDFKKELVSPLSKELGNASYALLRRRLHFPTGADHAEFRLPKTVETARALYELPLYAADLGAVTERTETVLRERGSYFRFLFRGEEKVLLKLFFFLSMEHPDFTAGGFYKILPSSGAEGTADD